MTSNEFQFLIRHDDSPRLPQNVRNRLRNDRIRGPCAAATPSATALNTNPLAPKPPHFPARAKHVIFLFLNGGPSQVDTFDPKPMLDKFNGKPVPSGNLQTERKTGNLLKSPFDFHRVRAERHRSERDLSEAGGAHGRYAA